MNPLYATIEQFAAEGYTHVEARIGRGAACPGRTVAGDYNRVRHSPYATANSLPYQRQSFRRTCQPISMTSTMKAISKSRMARSPACSLVRQRTLV